MMFDGREFGWMDVLVWLSGFLFGFIVKGILERLPAREAKASAKRKPDLSSRVNSRKTRRVDKWE